MMFWNYFSWLRVSACSRPAHFGFSPTLLVFQLCVGCQCCIARVISDLVFNISLCHLGRGQTWSLEPRSFSLQKITCAASVAFSVRGSKTPTQRHRGGSKIECVFPISVNPALERRWPGTFRQARITRSRWWTVNLVSTGRTCRATSLSKNPETICDDF